MSGTLFPLRRALAAQVLAFGAIGLSACGGGDGAPGAGASVSPAGATAMAELASATTTLQIDQAPEAALQAQAVPTFHLAPVVLTAPGGADSADANASALLAPSVQSVPAALVDLPSHRLTLQDMQATQELRKLHPRAADLAPLAGTSAVTTYSPAQMRAAYGFPALPTSFSGLAASQAALLGAGQTIYIVDAMHDPNVAAELAAFNQKFGLPTCTTKAIATNATLPLAAASGTACEFSVVYNTASAGMTATAPAYNAGWATEIALDVQWAHAMAPLARIVLIEAADSSLNSLLGGVKLANAMGPGIVSMSFGSAEGTYTASVDAAFTAPKMTYLAASGDSGAGVSWPAVSPNVLAVGGTTMTYSGTGARTETSWSGSGGGVSAYTSVPSYQTNAVPGLGTQTRRSVPDLALNADPSTGQYVAVMPSGSATVNWVSAGGTSISAPQWAGLIAVANATRVLAGKAVLGAPHAAVYTQISTVPGTYFSSFADIIKGSNGTCATCAAKTGYDTVTGLGTPNVSSLLTALSGATVAVPPPVVTPAAISGAVGTPLSFTVSVSAANPVTYSLSGAPSGLAIGSTGAVTWASPVAGTYAVTVTAKDSKTALTGQGVYTITIAAAKAPTVGSATISGKPGTALSFSVSYSSPNPVAYSLTGAPTGMTISTTGVINWPKPVLGTYNVTVTAKDSKTALSGSGVYTVKIANAGPVITTTAVTGVAGKAVSGTIAISDPGATSMSISITGVPMGMTFSISGMTITAKWASPVTGSYNLKITVLDSAGLSAQASMSITITAK